MSDNNREQIAYELPQGLLNWYDFRENSNILYVYSGIGVYAGALSEQKFSYRLAGIDEILSEEFQDNYKEFFDYIVSVRLLEIVVDKNEVLEALRKIASDNAILLLGAENRLGIRYFLGDTDPFTGHVMDGIDNYRELTWEQREHLNRRCFSKSEINLMLDKSGWKDVKCYSVMPSLEAPQLIFADTYRPREELANRYFPRYHSTKTLYVKEENILTDLIDNDLFHGMADALLFECSLNGKHSDALQVTISMDRGRSDAMATIVDTSGTVKKKALYREGQERLECLSDNMRQLREAGVPTLNGKLSNLVYETEFSNGILGNKYFQKLLRDGNIEEYLLKVDHYRDLLYRSSTLLRKNNELGAIYEKGYLDMMPINCFWWRDDFYFFDQEFVEDEYPIDAILYRGIASIYQGQPDIEAIYPMRKLWERYSLTDKWEKLDSYARKFTFNLRSGSSLEAYNKKTCRNDSTLKKNRLRMDYSEEDFEQLFYNPFVDIDDKQIYLFGSGKYAEKFIAMYRKDYDITGIVDNNASKWGSELEGYIISSPDIFYTLEPRDYKVIICIKNYDDVLAQLRQMGIVNIAVYESNKVYPGRQACAVYKDSVAVQGLKKYKVGYIAGVFDLYHLGHLNMFRRAKEQCEYLIVGVVTDEGVRQFKGKEPFIPFDERVEMVRSCRYVDEAVEIPFIYRTTKEAFEKYHFDVQFSGSDYQNNPEWLETKKYLEEHGSTMVFFPYTEQTSSTKIKALIDKGLA